MTPEEVIKLVNDEMDRRLGTIQDKQVFSKPIQIMDGRNIQIGLTTGTKIGTSTSQKISVYGETPVVQAGAISAPSGGGTVDAESRTAINSIRTALTNFGITA
jgi:hypothetical protein